MGNSHIFVRNYKTGIWDEGKEKSGTECVLVQLRCDSLRETSTYL